MANPSMTPRAAIAAAVGVAALGLSGAMTKANEPNTAALAGVPVLASPQSAVGTQPQRIAAFRQLATLQHYLIATQTEVVQLADEVNLPAEPSVAQAAPFAPVAATTGRVAHYTPAVAGMFEPPTLDAGDAVTWTNGGGEATAQAAAIPGRSVLASNSRGASCVFRNTIFPNGATTSCTVQPGPGVICPLGLHVFIWQCSNGQWLRMGLSN